MKSGRSAGALAAALALAACAPPPAPPPAGPALPPVQLLWPVGELSARGFLPADPYEDAQRAVAAHYALRERRFREAYAPGALWRYLRVEQADIDAGRVALPALLDIGRELFAVDFSVEQGLGNGLAARRSRLAGPRRAPNLRHVHYREFGGPDATRCLACHFVGGTGGGGSSADSTFLDGDGHTPTTALPRNPRALLGAALMQRLAEEMSAELQAQLAEAKKSLWSSTVHLSAKGVEFGTLRLLRHGGVDASELRGVDADLVVRPFGWKGTRATLRETVELSLQQNLGIQPEGMVAGPRRQRESLLGDGPYDDPDADGVEREATEGMVTALSAYLGALASPIEAPLPDPSMQLRAAAGAQLFVRLGCAVCHVPELPLFDPRIGFGPSAQSRPRVDLSPLLTAPGRLERQPGVRLFSDLKRHDMGESLAEPRDYLGVPRRQFLTPPLWGLAASAPYLHDGRAGTIDAAIAAHDGEARAAREAYAKLPLLESGALRLFLMTLDRPHHLEIKR